MTYRPYITKRESLIASLLVIAAAIGAVAMAIAACGCRV